jgi:exodeoxyribonuclease VII large subunit
VGPEPRGGATTLNLFQEADALSVTELTFHIRRLFDEDSLLNRVAVRGELSNFRRHHSGHCYFTLKDSAAALRCVMFRSRAVSLRFEPADGMQVRVLGRVAVYERDGSYQLYVDSMVADGLGDLSVAFARLREKLLEEGLFDDSRKQPLPLLPRAIGVVTSPTGAALRDIVTVARRRHAGIPILLAPVAVQGEEAPEQIVRGIQLLDRSGRVDVIIIGRGGGSIEELWAFNDERVVRAVAAATTPIVSAVGHQTDYTLSDFAADRRAATPSQAAEIVTPDRLALIQRLRTNQHRLNQSLLNRLIRRRLRLERCLASNLFRRPQEILQERMQRLDQLQDRLAGAVETLLNRKQQRWQLANEKLNLLDPLRVLQRGYSVVRRQDGQVVRRAETVGQGDRLDVWLQEGRLGVVVTETEKARQS